MKIKDFFIKKSSDCFYKIFNRGLGRKLFFWFICSSILPIILLSIFYNRSISNALSEQRSDKLKDICRIKAGEINSYFDKLISEVIKKSREKNTVETMDKFRRFSIVYGRTIDDFMKSPYWSRISEGDCHHLEMFKSLYDSHDLFLIDIKGNILYTVEKECDLGKNLFNVGYSNTLFSKSLKRCIDEDRLIFSGYEKYAPSNNLPSAFIVTSILGINKNIIGFLAIQILTDQSDKILSLKSGLGKTVECYLIGKDLKMRSNSIFEDKLTCLEYPVKTELTHQWLEEYTSDNPVGNKIKENNEFVKVYIGPRGKEVLGFYLNIDVLGVPMAIITEIETDDAFAPLNELRNAEILILVFAIIFGMILSLYISNRIVTPIREISLWAKEIAVGNLNVEEIEKEDTDLQMKFIETSCNDIAIAVNSTKGQGQTIILFGKTHNQTKMLQGQQEQLKNVCCDLEEQNLKVQSSVEELRAQSEELITINSELLDKTKSLEIQKEEISKSNIEFENASNDLERKAKELEITSKYKSEFLANMSHEFRTSLNSVLILAQDISRNKHGNLFEDQIESAQMIYRSGSDLLELINEILDFSKIEAGKMILNTGVILLEDIKEDMIFMFKPVFEEKGLEFNINIAENMPESIVTDRQRLGQILKNFLSNAVKFTKEGGVTLSISRPLSDINLSQSGIPVHEAIAISVTDTGIGIPDDKQIEVFEAFQQVDSSISRKYGGTGLGLSISRELARFLGAEIHLKSKEGGCSCFTLYIPERLELRGCDSFERRDSDCKKEKGDIFG